MLNITSTDVPRTLILREPSNQRNSTSAKAAASRVTVVSVTYNSMKVLPDMVESLPNDAELIVVDNCSKDIRDLRLYSKSEGFKLIENDTNIGFGAACNQGAAETNSEFILFLNPDAQLESGCLDGSINAFDKYIDCVGLNPAIINKDGTEYFRRGSVLIQKSRWLKRGWPAHDTVVPILSGSALFVRRTAFEAVEGFDDKIFLYHEDDDLSIRLAELGNLMFVRSAQVRHLSGESTKRSPKIAALKALHMGRSRVYAGMKHNIPMAFSRPLIQALIQLFSPINLISARKRAKSFAFLKGVWSARSAIRN